jgi:hypothetical protein
MVHTEALEGRNRRKFLIQLFTLITKPDSPNYKESVVFISTNNYQQQIWLKCEAPTD